MNRYNGCYFLLSQSPNASPEQMHAGAQHYERSPQETEDYMRQCQNVHNLFDASAECDLESPRTIQRNINAYHRLQRTKRPWIKRLWAWLWTKTTPHARNHS